MMRLTPFRFLSAPVQLLNSLLTPVYGIQQKLLFLCILLAIILGFSRISHPVVLQTTNLQTLLGPLDGAIVVNPQGKVIFSHHADQKRIPASTLKILTSLVALHYLGEDYRFKTEFYLDGASNLKVKGYGDPMLISEVLMDMVDQLSSHIDSAVLQNLILDDTYFAAPLNIPGVTSSAEPYDAPNGALCVNFNTVYFTRNQKGRYVSAEPQTPLLPFVMPRIKASGLTSGRIMFSNNRKEATLYAGHLLNYFLNEKGVGLNGLIQTGQVGGDDKLLLTYVSKYSLKQVITSLMKFSNNFVANQVLVNTGAVVHGPPGTLTKGVQVALDYAKQTLDIQDLILVEGSGISRGNKISPQHMMRILSAFKPYHDLMRTNGATFYKTGTLKGIQSRAGYIADDQGLLYQFAVFINTPGKSIDRIMDGILEITLNKTQGHIN